MSAKITKLFRFPIQWLKGYCRRFKAALTDEIVGPSVLEKLPSTFVTDFDAQVEIVAKFGLDQNQAKGAVHELTKPQEDARADVVFLSGVVRDAAKAALTGQDALLRSEFFVGDQDPRDIETVIDRTEKLLVNCRNRAEALQLEGWTVDDTKALDDAVKELKSTEDRQQQTTDDKEGCTAQQTIEANRLYRMCRTIQRVARTVYSEKKALTDSSVYAAREKYLLAEFPPRKGATPPDETPLTPPPTGGATTGGTPTSPA
jgi:hypothetical protein